MNSITIIPPDLRHVDTITQAAVSLCNIQKAINGAIERMDFRLKQNNVKIENLEWRIVEVRKKVKGLVGTKKAIRIYSPVLYPATHIFIDIPLSFMHSTNASSMMGNELVQPLILNVRTCLGSLSAPVLQEKIVFKFNRQTGDTEQILYATKQRLNQEKGLGALVDQIKSVDSLINNKKIYSINSKKELIFWEHAKLLTNGSQHRKSNHTNKLATLIDPAPYSVNNKQVGCQRHRTLFYTPRLDEAPEIDLPLHLPELPSIADDIQFVCEGHKKIAPSLLIDLPDFQELRTSVNDIEQQGKITPSTLLPPTPTPKPNHPLGTASTSSSLLAASKQLALEARDNRTSSSTSKENIHVARAHSDLMDAIRKAGGTHGGRLRSAVAEKFTSSLLKNQTVTYGNLISDLHNKLLMRRKGISGLRVEAATTICNNPVINSLSSLIPPPLTLSKNKQSIDDSDEENDIDWAD